MPKNAGAPCAVTTPVSPGAGAAIAALLACAVPRARAGVPGAPRRAVGAARLSLLLLAAATALAACSDPAPEAGCSTDADCPAGQRCSGGSCAAPQGGGGSGGGGPQPDECGASDDCVGAFPSIPTVYWDGSLDGADAVCVVPQRSCPAGSECAVPTVCSVAGPDATRLGLMRCERDEQCASGRCVESNGVSFCMRACGGNADCPAIEPPTVDPSVGFTCSTIVDAGIPLRLCTPIDPAFPERTLCSSDCDCVGSDDCTTGDGTTLCRFDGTSATTSMKALPLCTTVDPALPLLPSLAQCVDGPDSCHGGGCTTGCQAKGTTENFCYATTRCTQPCAADEDCPARAVCVVGRRYERIGSWSSGDDFPGREVRYCQLPVEGCFDERDCCPVRDAAGLCTGGWSADRRRCTAVLAPPADRPRLLTKCLPLPEPATLATPGQCCAGHAACDSNLCVPARAGTPCAGGGVCSVPCDPDPDPDGIPGSEDDRDLCAALDFGAETYHLGSSCKPFLYTQPYTDRSGQPATLEQELNACQ